MNNSYAIVGSHLLAAATKRGSPVVYHPSNLGFRHPRQFHELVAIANQWRWFDDVQDTWKSVSGIIEEVGAGQPDCIDEPQPWSCHDFDFGAKAENCSSYCAEVLRFVTAPRPGAWHDPDMLIVGNTPCSNVSRTNGLHCNTFTPAEEQTVMALWSLWSAPLIMSNNLPSIPAASKALLLNKDLLLLNQDPLGRMGTRFSTTLYGLSGGAAGHGWRKDLDDGDVAIVVHNPGETASLFTFEATQAGFAPDTQIHVRDMLEQKDLGWMRGSWKTGSVPPHGVAALRLSYVPKYPPFPPSPPGEEL
jgi:hypothetical protein